MSGSEWPGEERRRPRTSTAQWAVRAPLAAWLEAQAREAPAGYRVLDVGCGPKPYYPFFAERASAYVGVDIVDHPAADLVGPVEALPVDDGSFDVVLCTQVLEHADDPTRAVAELRRVTAPGGRVLASTHGVQVYHPSPQDYWRWTHAGLRRLFEEGADWDWVDVDAGAGTAACLAMLLGTYTEIALRRTALAAAAGVVAESCCGGARRPDRVAARAAAGLADGELPRRRHRRGLMRLFRRNVLGVYAVYAAAIVSGLVVTPILLDSIGDASFGIWSFIGAITIYLSVLDFGVGPTIVRYAAEARGRRAPEDTNAIASAGLALYGVIGLVTLPVGLVVAWLVPVLVDTPDDLVWEARVATFLVVLSIAARFPLGLFNNLLVGQQRFDLQNLANFISTVLYAVLVVVLMPNGGGLILLGALTLGTTLLRLVLPLRWLRRELPDLRLSRAFVTRERVRELVAFSGSNFLIHVANKVVFATDIVVVGIVLGAEAAALYAIPAKLFSLAFGLGSVGTGLLYPAFAEHEGAGEEERQRRLLLAGLRGGTAAAVLLALPLLFIPDLLIEGWVGEGYGESAPVLALLALVLLVHQPLYLVTQFLIARARQREIARALVAAGAANVVLSVVLAKTVGIWGVALSTLITDLAVLALRRAGAARAGGLARHGARSCGRRSGLCCPPS